MYTSFWRIVVAALSNYLWFMKFIISSLFFSPFSFRFTVVLSSSHRHILTSVNLTDFNVYGYISVSASAIDFITLYHAMLFHVLSRVQSENHRLPSRFLSVLAFYPMANNRVVQTRKPGKVNYVAVYPVYPRRISVWSTTQLWVLRRNPEKPCAIVVKCRASVSWSCTAVTRLNNTFRDRGRDKIPF